MTEIDSVQQAVQGYFSQRTGRNYVRLLDTPRVWGQPFGQQIMAQAWTRQGEFAQALEEVVQKSVWRCDISSLNAPDPDWAGVILGAMDVALTTKRGRTRPTQFRFLFGQTPTVPVGEPTNYTLFKDRVIRVVRARSGAWETLPEIWLARFYRLQEGVLDALQWKVFGGDGIFGSDDTKMTWNHSKIVAVDGSEALVGGHNLNMDLFRSYPPVHDVSVIVHGPGAYGAQAYLDQMWACNSDLLTTEQLDAKGLSWQNRDPASSRPIDPLKDPAASTYVNRRQAQLIQMHDSGVQGGAPDPDDDVGIVDDPTFTFSEAKADVFPVVTHTQYAAFTEYKLATGMLAVGKYWTGGLDTDYKKASELMKEQLIKGAKRIIRMSQMDLVSAWKKYWSDHVVCQEIIQALMANKLLTVQIVVSPLDAGAGAEGDQYSFGSGAVRTFDLMKYYMTHDPYTDAVLPDTDGARVEALRRLFVAPFYYTDAVPPSSTTEGETYKWPGLSSEGYTATLKQPPLSQQPPQRNVIGSAALSVLNASGYIYNKVPSAPGNHAKLTIIDDEAYVVGSDNLYPGALSEFNYLIEGADAVNELLKVYWEPLWQYSGPHARTVASPTRLKLVSASASSQLTAEYNGKPQTADRLLEDQDDTFWNSDDTGKDPTPWISVVLSEPCVVSEVGIRWKAKPGTLGARAMKYRIFRSTDGKSWTDTGRSHADVTNLAPTLDVDKLPGWPGATLAIRVNMSDSSYAPNDTYFTCHGVEVFGVPAAQA